MNKCMDMSSEMWSEVRSASEHIVRNLQNQNDGLNRDLYNVRQDSMLQMLKCSNTLI